MRKPLRFLSRALSLAAFPTVVTLFPPARHDERRSYGSGPPF